MAWPRRRRRDVDWSDRPVGVASSAAAQGIGGAITPLAVWAGYWSLAAVLFLLPDNRTRTSVTSAIIGMTSGQPGWYSHFLTNLGNLFSTTGTQTAWILALVSVVIGLGPLVVRRPGWFLGAGSLFAFLLWISGQGLIGNVFTGLDHRSQHGAADHPAGRGHGPHGHRGEGGMAIPRRRIAAAEPGGRRPGPGGPRRRARAERQLPPAPAESTGAAMAGMVDGGQRFERGERRDPVGHREHLCPAPGRSPDRRARPGQHALHDHGRDQRHGHERRRRQRRGRLQHDEAELALHGARPPAGRGAGIAGGRQQRARRHPHGAEWLRGAAHRRPGNRCRAVRAVDQRGGVAGTPARPRPWRPATSPSRRPTTRSSTT